MQAMILAAGRGSRLDPITRNRPKPMVQVQGRSLIDYHLQAMAIAQIRQVVVNLHYHADLLREHVSQRAQHYDLDVQFSYEPRVLETAGGINRALPLLEDPFIVCNADIFTDYPLTQLRLSDNDAHLVLVPPPVVDGASESVGDFGLQQQQVTNQPQYTFAGIGCYRKALFADLADAPAPLAPLLRQAIQQERVTGELYTGQWYDVGTHAVLEQLNGG